MRKTKREFKNALVFRAGEYFVTHNKYDRVKSLNKSLGDDIRFISWVDETSEEREVELQYIKVKTQVECVDGVPSFATLYIQSEIYEEKRPFFAGLSHIQLLHLAEFAIYKGKFIKCRYSLEDSIDEYLGITK